MGRWWGLWGFAADQYRKLCHENENPPRRSSEVCVGRSGLSVSIPWKWRQNCKRTSSSPSLKECTVCNVYGRRFRSPCRMRRTLKSDMPHAWTCSLTDLLGMRPTDAGTRAMFWGVRTEGGRPGGFLHATFPSSRHCHTHRRISFGDVASCRFISWRNPGQSQSPS